MDEELPYRILNLLRDLYIGNPTMYVGIDYFEPVFELPKNEIEETLIYLKEKDLIKSTLDPEDEWVYCINAKGMDELNNSEKVNQENYKKTHQEDDELLEFGVSHEDHGDKIKVFISHKFVKSDQKLARILENNLESHNIYGYLAERKKEYDIVFGEKIKNEIKSSDYLIAIITKNSQPAPSVNQEIGYAIGVGVHVRIMAEEKEAKGVLVEGKDMEVFSRDNFEKSLDNIIKDIKKNGIQKKVSPVEKEKLIEKIYAPCYDALVKITFTSLETTVKNPWNDISPALKLNIESEIKSLFEEFTIEVEKWNKILVQIETEFMHKEHNMAKILKPVFVERRLLNNAEDIILDERTSMSVLNWVKTFRYVLIDPSITDSYSLYEKLYEYSILKQNGHATWLKQLEMNTSLCSYMIHWLPDLRREINSEIGFEKLDEQREKVQNNYEKLFHSLEEKISQ